MPDSEKWLIDYLCADSGTLAPQPVAKNEPNLTTYNRRHVVLPPNDAMELDHSSIISRKPE
jgi:hypothetical protein